MSQKSNASIDEETIVNATETGAPPKRRITNPKAAWNVYTNMKRSYENIFTDRAKVQGMIDGNPPFSQSVLKRSAMKNATNVNFGEAKSIIQSMAASFWELLLEVGSLIQVNTKQSGEEIGINYGSIIAEEYTKILFGWTGFMWHSNFRVNEMLVHGTGPVIWHDDYCWKSKALQSSSVLYSKQCPSNVEDFDVWVVRMQIPFDDLYALVENEETSTKRGWNIPYLKEQIVKFFLEGHRESESADQTSQWEYLQTLIRNNDANLEERELEDFKVFAIFVREADGKISKLMLADNGVEQESFIYEGIGVYDRPEQVICPFFDNIGDGTARSVKSVGHAIFAHCHLSNKFMSSVFDSALVGSGLVVKMLSGFTADNLKIFRHGPFVVVPENMDINQTAFQPPLANMLALRSVSQQIVNNNIGVYRPRNEEANSPEKSATQVTSEEQKEARFERNKANFIYYQWDAWHKETYRRLVNPDYPKDVDGYEDHERFMKRCREAGIPDDVIQTAEIKTTRAVGLGSWMAKMRISAEVLELSKSFSERGQYAALREALGVRVGYENISQYLPDRQRNIVTLDHAEAAAENNFFKLGMEMPVSGEQRHLEHVTQHLKPLLEYVEAQKQEPAKFDYKQAITHFVYAMRHMPEHVKYIATNQQTAKHAKPLQETIKSVIKLFAPILAVYKKLVEDQTKKQSEIKQKIGDAEKVLQDRELQLKIQKIVSDAKVDMALGAMKAQSMDRQRSEKTKAGIQDKRRRTAADIEMKQALTQAELEAKQSRKEE